MDSGNPMTLSFVPTDGYAAYGISVRWPFAYLAAYGRGLQIVNITDPSNATTISSIFTASDARGVSVQWPLAYVAAYDRGLQIINIMNPTNATTLSSIPTNGGARGISAQWPLAYVAAYDRGLQIINITDPINTATISYLPIYGYYAYGVSVQSPLAYVAGSSGLQIIDLHEVLIFRRPASYIKYADISLLMVKAIDYSGKACFINFKITVDQLPILNNNIDNQRIFPQQKIFIAFTTNTLFTGRGYLRPSIESKPPWLTLTPTPKLISKYRYTTSSINDIAISETFAYLASDDGLLIIDISNLYSIFLANSYLTTAPATKIEIKDKIVFLVTKNELLIINTNSNPATLVHSYNYPGIVAIAYASNKLLISNKKQLISTPIDTTLSYIPTYSDAYGVSVQWPCVYLAAGSRGLQIINITDPNNVATLTSVATYGDALGVSIQRSSAYVAAYDRGLQIINITDPSNAKTLGYFQTNGYALGVSVQWPLAYVAIYDRGLQIINITDPSNPKNIGYVPSDGNALGVSAQWPLAYVAAYDKGLQIINIMDPRNATTIGYVFTYGYAYGVSVQWPLAYVAVAAASSGLQIINVSYITNINHNYIDIINCNYIATFNNSIKLLATSNDIKIIQPQDVNFNILGTYSMPSIKKIKIIDELIFIVNNLEMKIINFDSLINNDPMCLGTYKASAIINDIAISTNLKQAFIATNNGLEIVNITNISIPLLIGFYQTQTPALAVNIVDTTVFLVNGQSGLQILDCGFSWALVGAAAISDIGNYSLTLTVTDVLSAQVSGNFSIVVMSAPILVKNISNQIAYVNKLLDFSIPSSIFNDPNNNMLTFSASISIYSNTVFLPTWLTFDASRLRFYGTPALIDAYFYIDKILNVNLTAMNQGPIAASVIFNISVRGIERPPQVVNNISNQVAYTGKFFEFMLPKNTFADPYTLSYSAELANNADVEQTSASFRLSSNSASRQLPSWLSFDTSTPRFYGTPGMGDLNFFGDKNLKINITAMNPGPIGSSIIYDLTVTGMPYGVMVSIITGSVVAAGIIGVAVYCNLPIIAYSWHKITNTTKCWQFDERPKANKERKCNVYLMSQEHFDGQELGYVVRHCTPAVVYNQYGIVTKVILNKDPTPLTITLNEHEQELLPRRVIKNHSKVKKDRLKIGDPILNLIATKGNYNCSQEYQLISVPSTSKDFKKVLECYQRHPASGYDIKSIEIIYNPSMDAAFAENLKMLQARHNNSAFVPRFLEEDNTDEERELRIKINESWKNMAASYIDSSYPDVKLLPLWHGTRPEILPSIFKAGYANLATTDCGYFGKGLYSTYEAEYSYKYYYQGALILNWVSSYSAYPVIAGDMQKLIAKGTYQNYDTNFIPVVSYTRNNKDNFVPSNLDAVDDVYLPCATGQQPLYTEIVVFERAQCLPRYLVTLQPTLVRFLLPPMVSEEDRMRKLLKRQAEMLLITDSQESHLDTNLTVENEKEIELIHRRSLLVPNTPITPAHNGSPNNTLLHQFNKSSNNSPLRDPSKDYFAINRKSILSDEELHASFENKPELPEPIRLSEEAYLESSSSSLALLRNPR